ncbi:autoinducer binding domain-containing protein [Rhodosalinus sp. 5P4]|uniref:helix-turn-helix transcriptional regulator n=1 Tax=Rhodosalinus sp. 5P4 TaxID=3239196 RepID=UPI0035264F00
MTGLRLDGILKRLETAAGTDELQTAIEALGERLGVGQVGYRWVGPEGERYRLGTYCPAWLKRYAEMGYLRIDPVVRGCLDHVHPVDWKRLDWRGKTARAFLEDALRHGVGQQGVSVPLRGPNGQFALLTVNHDCDDVDWRAFSEAHRRDLILLGHMVNQKALELDASRAPVRACALSPREVDAMTLLAAGYSRAQVAETLAISEHTLRVYIESARFKLGAINTTHAVARAMSRGLIMP